MQGKVRDFQRRCGITMSAETALLDMIAELGELSKAYLNATQYGNNIVAAQASDPLREELGDLYFSLLSLANALNIDAEQALHESLAKLTRRWETSGHLGSGR